MNLFAPHFTLRPESHIHSGAYTKQMFYYCPLFARLKDTVRHSYSVNPLQALIRFLCAFLSTHTFIRPQRLTCSSDRWLKPQFLHWLTLREMSTGWRCVCASSLHKSNPWLLTPDWIGRYCATLKSIKVHNDINRASGKCTGMMDHTQSLLFINLFSQWSMRSRTPHQHAKFTYSKESNMVAVDKTVNHVSVFKIYFEMIFSYSFITLVSPALSLPHLYTLHKQIRSQRVEFHANITVNIIALSRVAATSCPAFPRRSPLLVCRISH